MKHIKKLVISVFLIILFLLLVFSVLFSLININNNKILKNISINNIDISNMTKEEAKTHLTSIINAKSSNNINYINNNETIGSSTFENLEINYNISDAVNKAFNIGRNSNIFKSNFEIINLYFNKKNINLEINLNNDKLSATLDNLSSNLPDKLIQSSFYIDNNNLILTSGNPGKVIDKESTSTTLNTCLQNLIQNDNIVRLSSKDATPEILDIDKIYTEIHKDMQNAYYEKNPLKIHSEVIGVSFDKELAKDILKENKEEYIIPLQYIYPTVTINNLDIDIFKDTIAIFTTKYNVTNTNRANNLELAAEKINGTILSPGEVFSYNKIVGARTIDKGYTEAKVYSNGQVVDGIGGGICQISSTLYDTAIIANLNVTERHNHQFITSYLPAGKDATVVYGAKDLKFQNNRSYPIKIELNVDNGIVTCKILGIKEETEYSITIETEIVSVTEPEIIYEHDSSLEIGQEKIKQYGSNGTVVNAYKITKLDGKIISKELLSQDTYKALQKIIQKNDVN